MQNYILFEETHLEEFYGSEVEVKLSKVPPES